MHPFKSYCSEEQFNKPLGQKNGNNSITMLPMISKFKLDLYLTMLYQYVNIESNWCIPLKVIDREPKVWQNLSQKGSEDCQHFVELFYKPFNETDASLQKLSIGNHKCDTN